MLMTLAVRETVEQTIVVPARDRAAFARKVEWALREFDLVARGTEFVGVFPNSPSDSNKILMQRRDRYVVSRARRLVPVSIRAGGSMARRVQEGRDRGAHIDRRFEVPYENRRDPIAYGPSDDLPHPALAKVGHRYIIHWTRASHRPWPTERAIDFFTAILQSPTYPREAVHSLCNIIETARIAGSSRHMPGRIPTVSFSGVPPAAMIPLMRWRARYAEMSFEPYGIGIPREVAGDHGIYPVRYHNRDAEAGDGPLWLRQSEGTKGNWRAEDEWRCRGDLELSTIPREKLVCFCRTSDEAREMNNRYGLAAVPLFQCSRTPPD
jgi:hypothetical protein